MWQNLWLRRELPLLLAILAIGGDCASPGSVLTRSISMIFGTELSTVVVRRMCGCLRIPSLPMHRRYFAGWGAALYAVWTHMDFVHPPLLHVAEIVGGCFGEGDIAARSFSIVCWLSADCADAHRGPGIEWPLHRGVGGSHFAAAADQVLLSEQVRAYGLMCAMGMGALVALVRLEKSPNAGWKAAIALGLCTAGD